MSVFRLGMCPRICSSKASTCRPVQTDFHTCPGSSTSSQPFCLSVSGGPHLLSASLRTSLCPKARALRTSKLNTGLNRHRMTLAPLVYPCGGHDSEPRAGFSRPALRLFSSSTRLCTARLLQSASESLSATSANNTTAGQYC